MDIQHKDPNGMSMHDRELAPLKVVFGMLATMLIGFSILSLVFSMAH